MSRLVKTLLIIFITFVSGISPAQNDSTQEQGSKKCLGNLGAKNEFLQAVDNVNEELKLSSEQLVQKRI